VLQVVETSVHDIHAPWPLVGRSAELERMGWAASNRRALVLAGQSGVGKTRLALQFLADAEKAGAATVRLTATRPASEIPFGAFAHLLPDLDAGGSCGIDQLFRRCIDGVLALASGRQLVLMADDAHLLDDASASLLRQMTLTRAAFVVVTIRAGERASDAVIGLWKDDDVERLDVKGLGAEDVGRLLVAVLGGPVDRATIDRLGAACQGNVLYLRELVLGALQDGTLRDDVGIWRLTGALAPSSRLVELVESRLVDLCDDERRLLEVVAQGEPLGTAELEAFGSRRLADRLERAGFLTSRTNGQRLEVRLAHPIYSDVVREQTPPVRSQEIQLELAEIVESTGARRREDTLRVATWRLAGRDADPQRTLAAAVIARWRYDFPLAERLARRAVRAGAGFDARLLAAQLAALNGRVDEADLELAALASEAVDDDQLARVTMARLDNHTFHLRGLDEGLQMAAEVEAVIEDPVRRDELSARRAGIVSVKHGPRAAAEIAEPILHRGSDRAVVWAAITATPTLAKLGRIDAALGSSTLGYEAHMRLEEPLDWYPWTHLYLRGEVFAHAGRLNETHAMAAERYEEAVIDRSPEAQAWFARLLAKTVADRGYPRTAAMNARLAISIFRELGRPYFEHSVLVYLATALALSGEAEAARDTLAAMDALGLPQGYSFAVDGEQARAWTEVAGGNLPAARSLLQDAAKLGAEIGDHTGEAAALHGLARLGEAGSVADQLAVVAERIEGVLAQGRARHALALAAGDAASLDEVSVDFEAMGAYLLAAEAAADAGVAWLHRGDARRGPRASRRARLLANRAENPVTASLAAFNVRSQLTRSEQQTARLAAAGHSNKEIAGELVVSVRTVENHLQHVYEKLGVSGRKDLTPAFLGVD
jgi:DNA-binding CsgD family transcriptional regulator